LRMEDMDENLWRQNIESMSEAYPLLDIRTGARPGGAFISAMTPAGVMDD